LLYATCSLFAEENEGQESAFLGRHAAFALVPLARAWPLVVSPHVGVPSGELPSGELPSGELPSGERPGEELPGAGPLCAGETLVLTPRQHGTDGFFAAVLERAA
jgi:16S rRNA (cytosine967-C5)-methyltransferase